MARDFADLRPGDVLYDLYTGTGTIANFCAARCARVVGVEYVPEAIADAKVNSELNGIENTVFYAGDMKAVLDDGFVAANGRPDVIILDPPRAGVDEPVIEVILRAAPERIVYVSCNPATQARDLQLMDAAYRVEAMQNARQSAATLAEAIGQKIGKCFYIYDSNNNVMPVFYDNMAVMRSAKAMGVAEDAAADEPLDFKTIKLQYNVQAKFVLE